MLRRVSTSIVITLLTSGLALLCLSSVQKESESRPLDTLPMPKSAYWIAPDTTLLYRSENASLLRYGRELIMHTSRYVGPRGSVGSLSNGMNCQNCHLQAGTKLFGNNYGSVAATYPRFRDRSGGIESLTKRISDCFERSLNGRAPDSSSTEMKALQMYILWLGRSLPKGQIASGSGLRELTLLHRAASPRLGKRIYENTCASCHMLSGSGVLMEDKKEYQYPPLWGRHSFNDAAGLFRLSNFARYIQCNMPFGVRADSTTLSTEQAWDVAAYVLSKPRPHKEALNDYPNRLKKPVDHPFAPYADTFSSRQHKYGPFQPIVDFYKKETSKLAQPE